MASIILSAAGMASGKYLAGTVGASLGQMLGASLGNAIDTQLFSSSITTHSQGPRLKDFNIQSASYGMMIPIVYGCVRIAGNIIWASPIKEVQTTERHTIGNSKSGKATRIHTDYIYYANIAISLCEGTVKEVRKIWANNKLLNLSLYKFRFYKGDENQLPDPLIEAYQGIGKTPAYRGLAYVVFEDFPLTDFANVLPNFTFEVLRSVQEEEKENIQDLVESIVIIPGCGEFVYDPIVHHKQMGTLFDKAWVQKGPSQALNQHTTFQTSNAIVAMDQLKENLPNIKWVAPTIAWFATSLDIKDAKILPGVEYDSNTMTSPSIWKVANFDRKTALSIMHHENKPIYGGTINDQSLLRYLDYLRKNNYKIMLYPLLLVHLLNKPWRGRITGNFESISHFFNHEIGYKNFILHYANLVKGKVDAFVIGSELVGLTKIKDPHNHFPAVHELMDLAKLVKDILGPDVIVTYAADWSEYHHSEGGWYNLDPLWSHPAIDVVGIDAYFPLSNVKSSQYDVGEIVRGWESDEGYDYFYSDDARTIKQKLDPSQAWKNLTWWWENEHINPNHQKTNWQPKSKKIWFTEYGFPSVDCCTNQHNVFYDPKSCESFLPYHSKGLPDFKAQTKAILATEKKWQNSKMVERKFLWTWDARPYPYWPDLRDVWDDGSLWLKGHSVQGKLHVSDLGAVIAELCMKVGLKNEILNTNQIKTDLAGMCINQSLSVSQAIMLLQSAYHFDICEMNGMLTFIEKTRHSINKIPQKELLIGENHALLHVSHQDKTRLSSFFNVNYIDPNNQYRIGNQHFQNQSALFHNLKTIDIPIVLTSTDAKNIAEIALNNELSKSTSYSFTLPGKYIFLTLGDLIELNYQQEKKLLKIVGLEVAENLDLKINALTENLNLYTKIGINESRAEVAINQPSPTQLKVLDLPVLPFETSVNQGHVYLVAYPTASNWEGARIYGSFDDVVGYQEIAIINNAATVGTALNPLKAKHTGLLDFESKIIVNLLHGQLYSISEKELFRGANLALIGNELVHFKSAVLLSDYQYELSGFIRGRQGTEQFASYHVSNEDFVLLNEQIQKIELNNDYIGKKYFVKVLSVGQTLSQVKALEFTYQANRLRPLAPVHARFDAKKMQLPWVRRTRFNGELKDHTDVSLMEEREVYLVEFLNDQNNVIYSKEVENPEILFTKEIEELRAVNILIT